MRELAILTFVTLDGVMQAPAEAEEDRSEDFKCGGWAVEYWDAVMAQVNEEAMAVPYDLLLGRKTYEIFAPHWTKTGEDSNEGAMLNTATKYVVTSSSDKLEWRNSIAVKGEVAAEVARLKAEDGPLLQVHGSWQLIQALLAHDLIDEFRLWTFPVVVGAGKRLFAEASGVPKKFTLTKTRATSNGVAMNFYRRADQ